MVNDQPQPGLRTSRRSLMRFAALTGVAGVAASASGLVQPQAHAADAKASAFNDTFPYPTVSGPSLALWGSSSIDGAFADQGVPAGFNATVQARLTELLAAPVLDFGRGGDTSSIIIARRGVPEFRYRLLFPNDMLPAEGSVQVTIPTDSRVEWGASTLLPGYVGAVPGILSAGEAEGTYTFTRVIPGEAIYAPHGTGANWFTSYQEMISRSSYHLIQVGRNNLSEPEKIQEHTQLAYNLAPERTIVMGHFRARGDARDSTMSKQVDAYNAWGAATYGSKFMNPETYLREVTREEWLRYGALNGSGVWSSDTDQKAYDEGKIPASLYASDGFHLNGWGYVALSHMISGKVKELGWF
ncbi:twin-arginine translocation signal domain-containing protein [Rothia nasimurium]|uniref:twin-arginine translocation signal domain-containing protein n=1 Tax=Rothia nasimurium TaxID=85336 RepID=UPI003B9F9752